MIGVILISLLACSPFIISLGVALWRSWKDSKRWSQSSGKRRFYK